MKNLSSKLNNLSGVVKGRKPSPSSLHFTSSSSVKRSFSGKSSGMTLIELLISVIILMLFFHTLFILGAKVYGYAGKVRKNTEIKGDCMRVFALMEKDLKSSGRVTILPENSGIAIDMMEGGSISWYGKDDKLMRKEKDRAVPALQIPVSDVIWADNGDILSLNLTFAYSSTNGKIITEKILHNFELNRGHNEK